jgi:regulator of nucleoside diphosphate kinase
MADRVIIVTDADVERLKRLVRALKYSLFRDQRQLELLDQTLESAEVRPPGRVPKDVVRMNSRVRVLDFDTRRKGLYTLVFPEEANISRGFISVLAPLGVALLGRRKGDVIEASVPGGTRMLKVERVQPRPDTRVERLAEQRPGKRASYHPRGQETALAV